MDSVSDLVSLFSQDDSDSEVSDSDLAISLSNHHTWHFNVFQVSEHWPRRIIVGLILLVVAFGFLPPKFWEMAGNL